MLPVKIFLSLIAATQFISAASLSQSALSPPEDNACYPGVPPSQIVEIIVDEDSTLINGEHAVTVNDIMVTGDGFYPLSVVLHNLDIDTDDLKAWKYKKILSVAEGFSPLLKYLKSWQLSICALDLWYTEIPEHLLSYSIPQKMDAFIKTHKNNIIAGDAFNLSFPSHSFDVLLSHKLVNNLNFVETLKVIQQALKVLKVNGEARIATFIASEIPDMQDALEETWGDSIEYKFVKRRIPWEFSNRTFQQETYLLKITKLK